MPLRLCFCTKSVWKTKNLGLIVYPGQVVCLAEVEDVDDGLVVDKAGQVVPAPRHHAANLAVPYMSNILGLKRYIQR